MLIRALFLLLCLVLESIASAAPPEPQIGFTPPEELQTVLAKRQQFDEAKAYLVTQMTEVAKGDPHAEELVTKFKNGTVPATMLPGGRVLIFHGPTAEGERKGTPLVIIGPEEFQRLQGSNMPNGVAYSNLGFEYMANEIWTPWYLGAKALQAAVYWDDSRSGRMPSLGHGVNDRSAQWLDGDLHALDVMVAAIDRHTKGGFTKAVKEMAAARGLSLPLAPQAFPRLTQKEVDELVLRAFGGEDALGKEEAHDRAFCVETAFYLGLAAPTPEARRAALAWYKDRLRAGDLRAPSI